MKCPYCGRKLSPSVVAAMLTSLRKTSSGGRPRSNKPRCPCGAMTLKRARARGHKCEVKSNVV